MHTAYEDVACGLCLHALIRICFVDFGPNEVLWAVGRRDVFIGCFADSNLFQGVDMCTLLEKVYTDLLINCKRIHVRSFESAALAAASYSVLVPPPIHDNHAHCPRSAGQRGNTDRRFDHYLARR
jgi:hypothetical protein